MAGNIITFDNVHFTYPGETEPLIKKCSFALEEGNHVAVKGESGTGKTSLFRLILGFEKPDRGKILYKGQPLNTDTIHRIRKESAWLPQDLNLGSGPVKEVLSFPFEFSANNGSSPDSDKFAATFEALGLEASLLENAFQDLSTGQRQRVGVALCHLLEKPLLLLDEPTSALDVKSKQQVFDLLASKSNSDHTILSTSHDPWWLERCEKIIELK